MHHSDGQPVIDAGVLAGLKELGGPEDPGLYLEVIEIFIQDAMAQMENLRNALASGDLKALERIAHTLKSSSASVGALSFSALCLQLEKAGRASQLEVATPLVETALAEFVRVRTALEAVKG
jgi:HPt (histidine-containing phosphotransfer) domain-containing protein